MNDCSVTLIERGSATPGVTAQWSLCRSFPKCVPPRVSSIFFRAFLPRPICAALRRLAGRSLRTIICWEGGSDDSRVVPAFHPSRCPISFPPLRHGLTGRGDFRWRPGNGGAIQLRNSRCARRLRRNGRWFGISATSSLPGSGPLGRSVRVCWTTA